MASSSIERDELSSTGESKNVAATSENLMMQSSSSVDAVDAQKSSKNLSSSSSESTTSPDSPFDGPFGEDNDSSLKSAKSALSLPEHDNDARIDHRNSEKPVAEASVPKNEAPPAESPPDQLMERSSTSNYRIPSRVFTRSKSNTPVEWSVASNDSLFSIHMGNMSFTKDQLLWRLDDLGAPGEASPSSHNMLSYSGRSQPSSKLADGKSKELGIGGEAVEEVPKLSDSQDQIQEKSVAEDHISHHSEENVSKAVDGRSNDTEPNEEILSLKESQYPVHEKPSADGHISRMSGESCNSTKSFAFPILEGADKGTSISTDSSPKLGTEQMRTHSQTIATPKKQQQPDQQSEVNSPAATQPQDGNSWLSFFPCSSCSSCRR